MRKDVGNQRNEIASPCGLKDSRILNFLPEAHDEPIVIFDEVWVRAVVLSHAQHYLSRDTEAGSLDVSIVSKNILHEFVSRCSIPSAHFVDRDSIWKAARRNDLKAVGIDRQLDVRDGDCAVAMGNGVDDRLSNGL